jgi:hypothetical protein
LRFRSRCGPWWKAGGEAFNHWEPGRGSGWWRWRSVLSGSISGLFYARNVGLDKDRESDCLNNIKQINLAAILYAEDHGGHAPPPAHWIEALQAYSKMRVFQCSAAKAGTVGYAYNPGAAGREWNSLPDAAKLVTFFDGTPGHDADGGRNAIVARHGIRPPFIATLAFADGRVRAATPAQAKAFRWKTNGSIH